MQRMLKYRNKCCVMRQIQSNRAQCYKRINGAMNVCTIIVTGTITFIGFSGVESISKYIELFFGKTISSDIILLSYNLSVFFLFLLTILHMVFNFTGKQSEAERAVASYAELINEIDDLIDAGKASSVKEIAAKYMIITQNKQNTDKEYIKAKEDLAKKETDKKNVTYTSVLLETRDRQEEYLKKLFEEDDFIQSALKLVLSKEHNGVRLYIGGGIIRDRVWDRLVNHEVHTQIKDIDVIYYDKIRKEKHFDEELEADLTEQMPNQKWSVKNQARMHEINNDEEYASLEDAISKWPETASAILVRKGKEGMYELIAPFGYDDLLRMIVRPTPHYESKLDKYVKRIEEHNWKEKWNNLIVLKPSK